MDINFQSNSVACAIGIGIGAVLASVAVVTAGYFSDRKEAALTDAVDKHLEVLQEDMVKEVASLLGKQQSAKQARNALARFVERKIKDLRRIETNDEVFERVQQALGKSMEIYMALWVEE